MNIYLDLFLTFLKLGATKWEDIPVEDLRDSLHIIDESIRVVKLDRPSQQLSMFY